MLPQYLPRFHFNSAFFFSHPGEMCARTHTEKVLNVPLLPRSCAKCCFGCIPAIDRSLAAGAERRQLGETALPLMNSSSSNPPKRPVDTAPLPVNKASHQLRLRALTDSQPLFVAAPPLLLAAAARRCAGFIPACLPHSDDFSVPTRDFQPDSALECTSRWIILVCPIFWPPLPSSANYPRSLMKLRTLTGFFSAALALRKGPFSGLRLRVLASL